jgi:hypothetical protein
MRYVTSVIVGIAAAVVASVLWVLAVFIVPVFLPFLMSRFTRSGGIGAASVGSGSILAVALVGFLAGFVWKFRGTSRLGAHPH